MRIASIEPSRTGLGKGTAYQAVESVWFWVAQRFSAAIKPLSPPAALAAEVGLPARKHFFSCPSAANALVFAILDWSRFASEFSQFRFSQAQLLFGMPIVSSLDVFLDPDSAFTDGDIGRMRVNPAPAIEIIHS